MLRKLISDRNRKKILDRFGPGYDAFVDNVNTFFQERKEKLKSPKVHKDQLTLV